MRRRLLCWAIVAIVFAGSTAAAQAQRFGGRLGGRAASGGRMGMGRQFNGGTQAMPVSQNGAVDSATGGAAAAETVPADPKTDGVKPGVAGEQPAVAVGGDAGGVPVDAGVAMDGGGMYPTTPVWEPGLAGRLAQNRGAREAFERGIPAMYAGNWPNGPWHAGYYETAWGRPMPLVVPPTATHQTDYGWGIGNTRVTRIWPQYGGPQAGYPYDPAAGVGSAEQWRPTPYWPSDTSQFGIYYIRGPW
ncbi:MAG: hypothetical protein AB7I37_18310 [Pirellulales bacterium]